MGHNLWQWERQGAPVHLASLQVLLLGCAAFHPAVAWSNSGCFSSTLRDEP